ELAGPAPALPAGAEIMPAPRPVSATVAAPPPVLGERRASWSGEIGVGLVGSVAGGGVAAPGLRGRGALRPPGPVSRGQLTLLAIGSRSVPLGSGSASWQRLALGLGGNVQMELVSRRLALELDADFLMSVLSSSGDGFSVTRTATAVDPGIMLSARLVGS